MKKGKDSCFSVMMILYGTYDFIMERCGYCVDMFHKTENKINGYCYFRNHFNFKGETWVMVAGAQYSIQAGENEQRIDFLKQFGWEVEQEPVSIEEIVIPQQFNQVYERYNELQKTQGMDLTKYAGKTVKKVVYQITNYQRQDTIVHATLLIYHDKVIGGDISSAELDGFMYGFMGEGSQETNQLSGSMIASEIEEASQQSKGEIPTTAYPTD